MRKSVLVITILLAAVSCFSQNDTLPLYLQFKTIPPFKLQKPDSSGWITKADLHKNHRTIIMLFSPDCEHCQHQTEILLENIEKLKDVQIVMATTSPPHIIEWFINKYEMSKHKNFLIGRDQQVLLGPFYKLNNIPLLAIYDKKGLLVKVFDGGAKWKKLEEALK